MADLVGCKAVSPQGEQLGKVSNVYDFGAGEVLEVVGKNGAIMVPFTRAAVPQVDVGAGLVVVVPPVFAPDEAEDKDGEEKGAEG